MKAVTDWRGLTSPKVIKTKEAKYFVIAKQKVEFGLKPGSLCVFMLVIPIGTTVVE